jgi:hypothetical protein
MKIRIQIIVGYIFVYFFIDTDVDTVFIWNRIDTGLDNYPDPDFFLK